MAHATRSELDATALRLCPKGLAMQTETKSTWRQYAELKRDALGSEPFEAPQVAVRVGPPSSPKGPFREATQEGPAPVTRQEMLDAARRTAARELFPGNLDWMFLVFVSLAALDLVLVSIIEASWTPLAAVVALTLLLLWWSKRRFDRALPAALAQAEKDYLALCEVTGQTPR